MMIIIIMIIMMMMMIIIIMIIIITFVSCATALISNHELLHLFFLPVLSSIPLDE